MSKNDTFAGFALWLRGGRLFWALLGGGDMRLILLFISIFLSHFRMFSGRSNVAAAMGDIKTAVQSKTLGAQNSRELPIFCAAMQWMPGRYVVFRTVCLNKPR